MLLYPKLLHSEAGGLARSRASLSIQAAREASRPEHPASIYSPTGGTRVDPDHLSELQSSIRQVANDHGYPVDLDLKNQQQFDAATAGVLKSDMKISASEASQTGVWSFLACVMLPDIVRWRYPGNEGETTLERFIGGSRGIRNTFGRLWWRAHLLGEENDFSLLHQLQEDELVQITERPVLAGNPDVARLFGRRFLDFSRELGELSRSDLMRDSIKRLRRLLSFLTLELLTAEQLQEVVNSVLRDSAVALGVKASRLEGVEASGAGAELGGRPSHPSATGRRVQGIRELEQVPETADELASVLEDTGLEVIDKRTAGGCLWVVDEPGVKEIVEQLTAGGHRFSLARNGARSTDGRKAWYLPRDALGANEAEDDVEEHDTGRSLDDSHGGERPSDIHNMDLWERGEFEGALLAPDFQVHLKDGIVNLIPNDNEASRIEWHLYDGTDEMRIRLKNLAELGHGPTRLAIVAAVMLRQQEFIKEGQGALLALTKRKIADDIDVHESTISRVPSDVYLETPSGLLPLEYFFSPGIQHRSGREISARAVRIHLRDIVRAESPESPFSDDEIADRLGEDGFLIARRTVAKYRKILGIPGAPERKKDGEGTG